MILATLFPAYAELDFDLDAATGNPIRLVLNVEQAIAWAEEELHGGRDPSIEWKRTEYDDGVLQGSNHVVIWGTECNEYGTEEEWLLFLREVEFYAPKK